MKWEPYDPAWLVEIARREIPDETWLAEALARCTRAWTSCTTYIHFVDPTNPNQPGSEWQFKQNLVFQNGRLVLDVLKSGRIGGVEFLDRLCEERESGTK